MKYRIIVLRRAKADMNELLNWVTPHAPETSDRWFKRLTESLQTLANFPERRPLIEEHRKIKTEIRQLLFGTPPNTIRILFSIWDQQVRVLRVLRAQRGPLTRRQLQEMLEQDEGDANIR